MEIAEQNEDMIVWSLLRIVDQGRKLRNTSCIDFADKLVKIYRNFDERRMELAHTILLKFQLLKQFSANEDLLSEENIELYQVYFQRLFI